METSAKQMKVSSEQIVSLALEDFFERQQNRNLLEAINDAYKIEPTEEEKRELSLMRNKSLEVLDEWK